MIKIGVMALGLTVAGSALGASIVSGDARRGEQLFPKTLRGRRHSVPDAPAVAGPLRHEIQDCAVDVGAHLFRRLSGIQHEAVAEPLDQLPVRLALALRFRRGNFLFPALQHAGRRVQQQD